MSFVVLLFAAGLLDGDVVVVFVPVFAGGSVDAGGCVVCWPGDC